MDKKKKAAKKAAELICSFGLADSDIAKIVPSIQLIDLAVKSKGTITRVSYGKPFEEAIGQNRGEDILHEVVFDDYRKNVVGTYPIKDCDHWLSSHEEYLRGDQVDHHRLPKLRYFERIYKILPAMNEVQAAVAAPKVEGYYLARPDDGSDDYLVVEMYEDKPFVYHHVDQHTPAKVRCVFKTQK